MGMQKKGYWDKGHRTFHVFSFLNILHVQQTSTEKISCLVRVTSTCEGISFGGNFGFFEGDPISLNEALLTL